MEARFLQPTTNELSRADAQMRAYLRAFATVIAPGAVVTLALCVAALAGVVA